MKKTKSDDKNWKTKPVKVEQTKTDSVKDAVVIVTKEKIERKTMTVGETKIGVTLVISKEECEQLGFGMKDTTKEVIKDIKKRLGLGV